MASLGLIPRKDTMKEQVVAEYLAGDTIKTLRKRYRCRVTKIMAILKEAGINAIAISNLRRTNKPIRKLLKGGLPKTPTELEWAYIAGIFDGEGCLSFEYNNSLMQNYRVGISQKYIRLLEWIQEKLGVGAIATRNRENGNHCSVFTLCAQRQVFEFLKAVLPCLIVKLEKAKEAIRLLQNRYDWS